MFFFCLGYAITHLFPHDTRAGVLPTDAPSPPAPQTVTISLLLLDDLTLGPRAHLYFFGALTVYPSIPGRPQAIALAWLPLQGIPRTGWLDDNGQLSAGAPLRPPSHHNYFLMDSIAMRELVDLLGGLPLAEPLPDGASFYAWVFAPGLSEQAQKERLLCATQSLERFPSQALAQQINLWFGAQRGRHINHDIDPLWLNQVLRAISDNGVDWILPTCLECDTLTTCQGQPTKP